MQHITPFLWFNDNAEAAVKFYTSTFKNAGIKNTTRYDDSSAKASGQPKGSIMTIAFTLEGQTFTALNGGPNFATFSPAISFFVTCKTKEEVDTLWKKLSAGGSVRMALDKYPWSERYGWCQDKFGVDWQLMLGEAPQKITPCFLFVGKRFGTAEKAIKHYMSVFKDAKTLMLEKYQEGEGHKGAVKHARITLNGYEFAVMDGPGPHQFDFTGAISFIINCETQQEIDHYWKELGKGGQEMPCGWLQDQFGIVWQVVPKNIDKLLSSPNAWKAMMTMKKLDIKKLQEA